jgi:hypothetical protein
MRAEFSRRFEADGSKPDLGQLTIGIADQNLPSLPVAIRSADMHLLGYGKTNSEVHLDPGVYVIELQQPDGRTQQQVVTINKGLNDPFEFPALEDRATPVEASASKVGIRPFLSSRSKPSQEDWVVVVPKLLDLDDLQTSFEDSNIAFSKEDIFLPYDMEDQKDDYQYCSISFTPSPPPVSGQAVSSGYMYRLLEFRDAGWQVVNTVEGGSALPTVTIESSHRSRLHVSARDQVQLLECKKPLGQHTSVLLPMHRRTQMDAGEIVITDAGDTLQVTTDLAQTPRVAAMLEYMSSSSLEFAATLLDDAHDTLQDKVANPVAAALGGYVLLRIGDLKRLHNWPENLCNWFTTLADGAIIAGELAARKGESRKARKFFLEACRRGLPVFSAGFRMLTARMREYALTEKNNEEVTGHYRRLARLSLYADDSHEILTINGPSLAAADQSDKGWRYPLQPGMIQAGVDVTSLPVQLAVKD